MPDPVLRFPIRPLQPGGFSTIDTGGVSGQQAIPGSPVVALLGDAKGGKPNVPVYYQDPQTARTALRSGPLVDCVRAAFIAGATRICTIRVGNGIAQSTKALAGATGSPVTLTAIDYGVWTNSIRATVAANNKVTTTFTDGFGVTYNEVFDLGAAATAQQVVDAINGAKAGFSRSQYVTAAVTAGTMPLTVAAIANMAGGADTGAIVAGDWTTGLTALEPEQLDLVGVASGDSTVHAQVFAHCNAMSAVQARRERTSVLGGILGETDVQAAARAVAILQNRAQLIYPGGYMYDDLGNQVLYDPYVMAAGIMGAHAALPDQATSLTHDVMPWILDVEKRLSTAPGGAIDNLLKNGVTPLAPAEGNQGIWVVDSLSTNLSAPQLADFHKIRTADEVSKRLRRRLEARFVGGKTLNGSAQEMANEATAELGSQLRSALIRDFLPVGVQSDPADPRTYLVSAPVVLPDTTKFVLITVALRPPMQTIAAADTVA